MARGCKNNSVALTRRLLYTNFQGNRFTRKGLIEEENTRKEYSNMKNKEGEETSKIDVPGLVISKEFSHLAASSGGIVTFRNGTTGLIEIKNLLQTSDQTIKEAAVHQKQFCLKTHGNTLQLKRNHKYFYQIQGQLNILQQPWCDLIVRRTNPYDIFIERILRDEQLWIEQMVPKLSAFYFTHLLPELAAPRMGTTTGIRKATVPWFEPKLKATATQSATPETKLKPTSTQSATPVPPDPFPTVTAASRSRTRQQKLKLVGRRILHMWEEADGTQKWYTATVTGVKSGKDGDTTAVYHVYYEEEDETYDIEGLVGDYNEGSLKFCDL